MNSLTLSQKLLYILSQNNELTEEHINNLCSIHSADDLLNYVEIYCSGEVYEQFLKLMN